MKICPNCSNANNDTAGFCQQCGYQFNPSMNYSTGSQENAPTYHQTEGSKFCSSCGAQIPISSTICPKCGSRLGSIEDNIGKKSKTPFILGLIGGVIGFLVSIAFIGLGAAFQGIGSGLGSSSLTKDANSITFLAGMGVLWSIIGIIGASISLSSKRSVSVVAGIIMLISAFGGLLVDSIGIFYGLSFILFLIAAILAFRTKAAKSSHTITGT